MLKQLLGNSLIEILKPGCPGNIERLEGLVYHDFIQDEGSKMLFVKFGVMKIIPNDRLHQEYLTINLGITSY